MSLHSLFQSVLCGFRTSKYYEQILNYGITRDMQCSFGQVLINHADWAAQKSGTCYVLST